MELENGHSKESTKSPRPLNCLQLKYVSALCDPVTLFDLILNGHPGLTMDYPCGKFGDCSSAAVLVLSCGQTHTQMHTHTDTNMDKCFILTSLVSMSNDFFYKCLTPDKKCHSIRARSHHIPHACVEITFTDHSNAVPAIHQD